MSTTGTPLRHVRSSDGTTIAFERTGSGPPLLLVDAADHYRNVSSFRPLTDLLVATSPSTTMTAEASTPRAPVWCADVGNRRCGRVREGGNVLRTVDLDRGCFSCALGGPPARRCSPSPRSGARPPR
jgi:hypothetical protein